MQTEAVFDNIAERIQLEINQAQHSIYVAVAWFTNHELFELLLQKAQGGTTVSLLLSNDHINANSDLEYELLNIGKSRVFPIGEGKEELLQNNFCVIDSNVVITGSYNWSYKAESNFDNIILTRNDRQLAQQFIAEFHRIRQRSHNYPDAEENFLPVDKLLKRLEILKNYILLEDLPEIDRQLAKLNQYELPPDLDTLVPHLRQRQYGAAVASIQAFLNANQQLATWIDPEIAALQLEIKLLENQLNSFENEKIECEKILAQYQHRHALELGPLLLQILRLNKIKYKDDQAKYEEFQKDEEQYQEQVQAEQQKNIFELSSEQRQELKQKFRQASIRCHPDKVAEAFKKQAAELFIELKQAYDANDLARVSAILEMLEKDTHAFKSTSETLTQKHSLLATLAHLKQRIQTLEDAIRAIKTSDIYQTVAAIADWDDYFRLTKELLEQELEALEKEVSPTSESF